MEEQIQENPLESETVQPIPVEPKKKTKLSIIAILLVVILLIAGGIYAGMQIGKKQVVGGLLTKATPTPISQPTEVPDETVYTEQSRSANWKTYRNEKYGFEFKYPEDWKFEEDLNNKIQIIVLDPQKTTLKENIQQALDGVNGLVGVMASSDVNSSIVGWNALKKGTIGANKIKVRISEERTDNNVPNPALSNKHIVSYFLEDKGIIVRYISNFDDTYLTQFDQILSTFKFLD